MYRSNEDIARRVYRALKTPTDNSPRTDPILAFHFKGKDDYIMLRCNKAPELSVKGKEQTAGEVKFFAYSDFSEFSEADVLFKLRDEIILVELYRKGRHRGAVVQVMERIRAVARHARRERGSDLAETALFGLRRRQESVTLDAELHRRGDQESHQVRGRLVRRGACAQARPTRGAARRSRTRPSRIASA